jgi:hypothetical protein
MSEAKPKTGGSDTTAASDARQTDVDGTDDEKVAGLTDDELFELLSNQRRRFVLHYLAGHADEPVSLSTLSERVAGWEHGVAPAELDYRERKSVRNSLHQFHLPKLADAGIVTYDDSADEIALEDLTVVDVYHTMAAGDDSEWWTSYVVGTAVGAVGVLALTSVAGGIGGIVPWVFAALTIIAATAASYQSRRPSGVADGPPPEYVG